MPRARPFHWFTSTFLPCLSLLLAGCGSDGGSTSSTLEDAASLEGATYVVVDTGSGRVYGRKTLSGLETDADYRTDLMVFRRIEAGSGTLGHPGDPFAQADETSAGASVGTYYLAVFECSQDQWHQLTGTRPWTGLSSELSHVAGTAAAHNLSYDSAVAGLQAANHKLASGSLRLPSETEWEYAARLDTAVSPSSYTFADITGTPPSTADLQPHAWTFETVAGQVGPFTVGSLDHSPGGFWDLHGNVWELTASGAVRGGSWRDVALQARIANRNTSLDRDIPHPLVGLRLALDLR